MSNPEAVAKAVKEASEWLARKRQIMLGREAISQGEKGAYATKENLASARELMAKSKEQAALLKRTGVKGSSRWPDASQTMATFEPGSLMKPPLGMHDIRENVMPGGKGDLVGFMRKITKDEVKHAQPAQVRGYTPGDKKFWGKNDARFGMFSADGPGKYRVTMQMNGNPGQAPIVINTAKLTNPHELLHTVAHESQHTARLRSGRALDTEESLGLGRKNYSWAHLPSEARAQNFADWSMGTPAKHMMGERPTIALGRANNSLDKIVEGATNADLPPSSGKTFGNLATSRPNFNSPNAANQYNVFKIAENLGLPVKMLNPNKAAIPARRVQKELARHDAQALIDLNRASLAGSDYKDFLRNVRPALRDSIPGLRYGLGVAAPALAVTAARQAALQRRSELQ